MFRLVRTAQRAIWSTVKSEPFHGIRHLSNFSRLPWKNSSMFHFQTRPFVSEGSPKSHFEANIIRILSSEMQYQFDYAPPHQPVTKFKAFTVQDRPGEQWITMRGKFGVIEDIKMEATMFDGFKTVPKIGDDVSEEEDVHLHISLLVDIKRGYGDNDLEFVCSLWPKNLEIEKVYILNRDKMLARPYMGPDFKNLKSEFQNIFRKFLVTRGVDDELAVFLHEYMMNKDRCEHIQWLGNVKSFVEI